LKKKGCGNKAKNEQVITHLLRILSNNAMQLIGRPPLSLPWPNLLAKCSYIACILQFCLLSHDRVLLQLLNSTWLLCSCDPIFKICHSKLFFGKLLCAPYHLRTGRKLKKGRWVYDRGGLFECSSIPKLLKPFQPLARDQNSRKPSRSCNVTVTGIATVVKCPLALSGRRHDT